MERIMERLPRSIEDSLLKKIMEGLRQRVIDYLLLSRIMETLPREEGRAARDDQRRERSAIRQAEKDGRRPGAGQKGRRHRVARQHEW